MSKLYVWVNSKLSPIQKGIQASHVQTNITADFLVDTDADQASREEFQKWVVDDVRGKTIIVLEGGSHRDLDAFSDFLDEMPEDDHYPWSAFYENDLNDCLVGVGLVLDEEWDEGNRVNLANSGNLNPWESRLLNKLMTSVEAR